MTSAGPCRPCPGSTSLAALLICESQAQRQAKRWLNLAALLVLAPGGDVVLDVGDVVLDHERTLAQRGILAGACLSLKTAGLLGGGGHSKLFERAAVADASAGGGAQRSKFVAELSTAESTGLKRPLDLLASRAETQHTAALKAQRAAAALTNARLNDENDSGKASDAVFQEAHGAKPQAVEAREKLVREKLGGDLVLRAGAPAGGGQAAGKAGASWHGQIFVRLNQDGGAQTVTLEGGLTLRTRATRVLELSSQDTVAMVKERVPGAERMVFGGKDLPDHATIAECGVARDSTLDALPRCRGGAPTAAGGAEAYSAEHLATVRRELDLMRHLSQEMGARVARLQEEAAGERRALEQQLRALEQELAAARAAAGARGDDAEKTVLRGQVLALLQQVALQTCPAASDATPPAMSPPEHGDEPRETPEIPHALMLALRVLDDAELCREFDAHADLADDKGERRMSKAGLASFMRAQGLAHGDSKVERFLARVDANNDGEIDFGEFRALARANSDLEKVLQSKRLECILCASFPSGTTLEDLTTMDRSQFAAIVDLSKPALVQLLVDLAAQMAEVGKAQDAAGGGKFTGELKGGPLDAFYEGVTGVCGPPDADIEKGMCEEHTDRPDSHVEFSTPNYGLATTPAKEWALVFEGGSGCAKAEGKEDSVIVTSTRGCCKASGLKWLNTGNTDPTRTLGSKWVAVGDMHPTEGRQLTNSMLAATLASKTAAAEEQQQLTKVVEFTKEDLDSFHVNGLRSTDFIEAGGSYFKPAASIAQILDNPRLADALMHKTEFTQQEWDAFGVHDLGMHHFVKSGDSYFRPAGTEAQADVRVLRTLAHYGDFGGDGRLKWGVGDEVVVGEALTAEEIAKDTEGTVLEVSAKGAKIAFREPFSDDEDAAWVPSDQFYRLYPRPSARDTPIQRMVKEGRLRRCDVFALILYTGPMFVIYNALLRGFGFCGAVAPGIEFASDEFWAQWKAVDINAWVERSGHRFTNTIHALASAIKKLQGLAAQEPSTRLYRGLGGLSVAEFAASLGFTDRAFMSTTKHRDIALEYSGVHKGLVGTVMCIETSTTNNGAVLLRFSQYPEEEEMVWNACSFLQHLPGREEVLLLPEGGVVRIYHVLVTANSRAETVEELESRRKRVVVQVLDTLHADVCRAVDAATKTAEFKARVSQDKYGNYEDYFIDSIKDESAARVAVYKALPDGAYAEIEMVGEAVSKGLALPLLANAKLRLWLEDTSLNLVDMFRLGLDVAQGRRLVRRRLLLQDSSASGRRGSIDSVGRIVVEDGLGRMGGTGTAALALEDCSERRLVTGAEPAALERRDPFSGETPLITQVQLGEHEHVERLLQAGADANAATAERTISVAGGERALLIAAKAGREDLVELLAGFKADLDARYGFNRTVLHLMAEEGKVDMVQVLLKVGADTEAKDQNGWTTLHLASYSGHLAVVRTLLDHGADVAAKAEFGGTSLHKASERGHPAVVQTLLDHGADVAARDNDGQTALDVARDEEVKAALREHGDKHS